METGPALTFNEAHCGLGPALGITVDEFGYGSIRQARGEAVKGEREAMKFTGKILQNGQIVLPHVGGTMTTDTRLDGNQFTAGSFVVPSGYGLVASDDYELVLPDGKTAGVRVLNVSCESSQPTIAHFRLNGTWR